MSLEDFKENLQKRVPELQALGVQQHDGRGCRLEIEALPEQVTDIARVARETDFYLETVTAVHFSDGMQVVYFFNSFSDPARVQVRVQLGKQESLPSISAVYDAALWHEREVFDLFGIRFVNHPDLRRLLLPEDADFHPLRKDFGRVHALRASRDIHGNSNS
jgi:NADH-quinone oxidoreductase subunit C